MEHSEAILLDLSRLLEHQRFLGLEKAILFEVIAFYVICKILKNII
jgi:hypothetical protein